VLVVGPLLHHGAIRRRRVLESLQIGEGFRLAMECHMLGGGGAFGDGLGQEVELLLEDVGGLDDGRRQGQVACLGQRPHRSRPAGTPSQGPQRLERRGARR